MADWPRPFHPIVDGRVDRDRTVQVFAHVAGRSGDLTAWAGGEVVMVGGAPCVILPGQRPCAQRLVGLGDVAVADGVTSVFGVPGGELSTRLWPADIDEAPPAD